IDHNSILGFFWSFLGPLAMLAVTYAIFSARFGKNIYAYPLYLLSGIIMVNFFINTTFYVMKSFYEALPMMLNTTVRREVILVSHIPIPLYKFLIELLFCVALSVFYGRFSPTMVLLGLPIIASFTAFILGVSLLLALLFCFARDVEHLWMLISRVLLFISPIFYELKDISSWARKFVYFGNPLTPFVISLRELLMGRFDAASYAYSLFLGVFFLALGYWAFCRLEDTAVERA
ncbi:MAG: hypothetical protein A2285_02190, partial [Elusimicrobia bacterium RIFOXYA12_FULL_57_11]